MGLSPLDIMQQSHHNLKSMGPDPKIISEMESRGVLHLDWAPEINSKRVDEDGDSLPPPPDGRSYLDRMFGIALGVGHS